jgi:hypothetical protein
VNLLQSALFIGGVCVPGFLHAGFPELEEFPLLWWGGAVVVVVLLVFAIRRIRSWPVHRWLLLLNLAVILVWPYESYRFWAFLMPFLLLELLNGASALGGRWGARGLGVVVLGAAVLSTVPERVVRTEEVFTFGGRAHDLRSTFEGLEGVRRVLPPDAVIASTRDTFAAAHGGLRGVDGWVTDQLFTRYYGPERRLRTFFLTSDTVGLVMRLFGAWPEVLAQWRRVGVTHVVQFSTIGDRVAGSLMGSLVHRMEQLGRAQLEYETPDEDVQVWRVEP